MAWNATAIDFVSGSQGTNPAVTMQNAIAREISPNVWQSPIQAIAATNAYIQASIHSGNFAGATHAAQDLATPGHAGQPWRGFGLNWETTKHILGDIFPSLIKHNHPSVSKY